MDAEKPNLPLISTDATERDAGGKHPGGNRKGTVWLLLERDGNRGDKENFKAVGRRRGQASEPRGPFPSF